MQSRYSCIAVFLSLISGCDLGPERPQPHVSLSGHDQISPDPLLLSAGTLPKNDSNTISVDLENLTEGTVSVRIEAISTSQSQRIIRSYDVGDFSPGYHAENPLDIASLAVTSVGSGCGVVRLLAWPSLANGDILRPSSPLLIFFCPDINGVEFSWAPLEFNKAGESLAPVLVTKVSESVNFLPKQDSDGDSSAGRE